MNWGTLTPLVGPEGDLAGKVSKADNVKTHKVECMCIYYSSQVPDIGSGSRNYILGVFPSNLTTFVRRRQSGGPQSHTTSIFYSQKPRKNGLFSTFTVSFFHRFLTKHNLNNNILTLQKIL